MATTTPMNRLFAGLHGDDGGETVKRYGERITTYLDSEHSDIEAVRHRPQGERPWPRADENVMLTYLMARAMELMETEGLEAGLVWLAVHAWFEGGVAEHDAVVKALDS